MGLESEVVREIAKAEKEFRKTDDAIAKELAGAVRTLRVGVRVRRTLTLTATRTLTLAPTRTLTLTRCARCARSLSPRGATRAGA